MSSRRHSTYVPLKVFELELRLWATKTRTCCLSEIGRINVGNIGLLGGDHI